MLIMLTLFCHILSGFWCLVIWVSFKLYYCPLVDIFSYSKHITLILLTVLKKEAKMIAMLRYMLMTVALCTLSGIFRHLGKYNVQLIQFTINCISN